MGKGKEQEKQPRICPLMTFRDIMMEPNALANRTDPKPFSVDFPCREVHCAWWIPDRNLCSVAVLARNPAKDKEKMVPIKPLS